MPALLELLEELASRPRTELHVVSGRAREALEHWLGRLPIALHAEHGFWSRSLGETEWTASRRGRRRVAGAGAGHPAGHHRPHTGFADRGQVGCAGLALPHGGSGGGRPPGQRAAPASHPAAEQPAGRDPGRPQGHRDPALRRSQGAHRSAALARDDWPRPPCSPSATIAPTRTSSRPCPPTAITIRVGPGPTRARFRLDGVAAVQSPAPLAGRGRGSPISRANPRGSRRSSSPSSGSASRTTGCAACSSCTSSTPPAADWDGPRRRASRLYGWFTGLAYLTPVLGGWLADRYLGTNRSLVMGGALLTLGYFTLALGQTWSRSTPGWG